jgi:hypothetical protein
VVVMAFLAFGGQVLMTASLRRLKAITIGVIAQLAVVVSMLLGYFFLGEPLTLRIIAAALLTTGGIIGFIRYCEPDSPGVTVSAKLTSDAAHRFDRTLGVPARPHRQETQRAA